MLAFLCKNLDYKPQFNFFFNFLISNLFILTINVIMFTHEYENNTRSSRCFIVYHSIYTPPPPPREPPSPYPHPSGHPLSCSPYIQTFPVFVNLNVAFGILFQHTYDVCLWCIRNGSILLYYSIHNRLIQEGLSDKAVS